MRNMRMPCKGNIWIFLELLKNVEFTLDIMYRGQCENNGEGNVIPPG
jgi:hypothetical protein